jgi:hypothetical protein
MNCTAHPAQAIVGSCNRCGNFVCALDSKAVKNELHCLDCAGRVVDHLGALREEYWGKRDGWGWLIGGIGTIKNVLTVAGVVALLFTSGAGTTVNLQLLGLLGFLVLSTVVSVGYFLGRSFARGGLIVLSLLGFVLIPLDTMTPAGINASMNVVGLLMSIAIYADTRNKLFFKVDPGEKQLEKLWQRLKNNQLAQTGLFASILGLLIPGVSLIALACSLIGLSRVNPTATPPIGRRGMAIAGTILSVVGLVGWVVLIAGSALHR